MLAKATLAFFQCRTEKGIAVRGQYNLPGTEVEGDGAHMLSGDGESVDNAIGDILLAHGIEHTRDDDGTGDVVTQQFVLGLTSSKQAPDFFSTHACQFRLVGLGIVVVFGGEGGLVAIKWREQTMAVANHPYLPVESAEDDDRTGQSLLGMLGQTRQHRLLIMLSDVCRDTRHKLLTICGLGHAGDITAD